MSLPEFPGFRWWSWDDRVAHLRPFRSKGQALCGEHLSTASCYALPDDKLCADCIAAVPALSSSAGASPDHVCGVDTCAHATTDAALSAHGAGQEDGYRAGRLAAIEECAKVAESLRVKRPTGMAHQSGITTKVCKGNAEEIAIAIRTLKEKP
jgi:hypothetical protein